VAVFTRVGVAAFVGATAGVGVRVGRLGVKNHHQRRTGIGVGVLVGVKVRVGVRLDGVGEEVGVSVNVAVGAAVGVPVAVGGGDCVGDAVAVGLGVGVAPERIEALRQLAPAIFGSISDKLHAENCNSSAELM
jgi:hypothetical protein